MAFSDIAATYETLRDIEEQIQQLQAEKASLQARALEINQLVAQLQAQAQAAIAQLKTQVGGL